MMSLRPSKSYRRDALRARLARLDTIAARWSASARFSPSEPAISSPSEDTATASRTPSVWWTKLPSSQLNWCRSAWRVNAHADFFRPRRGLRRLRVGRRVSALPRCTPLRKAVSRARTWSGESLTGAGRSPVRPAVRRRCAVAGCAVLRAAGVRLRRPLRRSASAPASGGCDRSNVRRGRSRRRRSRRCDPARRCGRRGDRPRLPARSRARSWSAGCAAWCSGCRSARPAALGGSGRQLGRARSDPPARVRLAPARLGGPPAAGAVTACGPASSDGGSTIRAVTPVTGDGASCTLDAHARWPAGRPRSGRGSGSGAAMKSPSPRSRALARLEVRRGSCRCPGR